MIKVSPNQLPLDFDPSKARAVDPKTSRDAAKFNPTGIRQRILSILYHAGRPLATFQIADSMGIPRDSISPHMKPLERIGCVRRSGQTVVNPHSVRKVSSEAWEITNTGIDYL